MRTFLLYSKGSTSPFFIDDMPGSGKRMDVVARCINSALWLSDSIRRDTRIFVSLNGGENAPKSFFFTGDELRRVSPDERNIGTWLKKIVEKSPEGWEKVQEGISVSDKSFLEILSELEGNIYILDESGEDIRNFELKENSIFILGDNQGIPEDILRKIDGKKVSIGPKTYLGSHCITLVNNELDRNEI